MTPSLTFGGVLKTTFAGLVGARRPLHVRRRRVRRLLRRRAARARDRGPGDPAVPDPAHVRPAQPAGRRRRASGRDEIVRALGRRHARLLRAAARQELLLLRRRPVADRLRVRARLRDGRRRPDRAAGGHGRARSTSSSPSAPSSGWRRRVPRRARGGRADLPRARHARDLPRRRGDPPLRHVHARGRRR